MSAENIKKKANYAKVPLTEKDDSKNDDHDDIKEIEIEMNEESKKEKTEKEDDNDNDNDSVFDDIKYKTLNKFGKMIPPFFIGLAIVALLLAVTSCIGKSTNKFNPIFTGLILFVLTLFGSYLGAWASYKYGTITQQIERFKQENDKFADSLDSMKQSRTQLSGEVLFIQKSVDSMKTESKQLEANIDEFDDLRRRYIYMYSIHD